MVLGGGGEDCVFQNMSMVTGEAIITGELMATGDAGVHVLNAQKIWRNGEIIASRERRFACWPSSYMYLEFSSVFIFVPSELHRK